MLHCVLMNALASFLFQEAKGDYVRYDFFLLLLLCLKFGDAIHEVLDAIDAF